MDIPPVNVKMDSIRCWLWILVPALVFMFWSNWKLQKFHDSYRNSGIITTTGGGGDVKSVFCEGGEQLLLPFRLGPVSTMRCDLCRLKRPVTTRRLRLRHPWLLEKHLPLQYNMFLHPPNEDQYISGSFLADDGNKGFEAWERRMIYEFLVSGTRATPVPAKPLLVDVGANIGIHALFSAALQIETHAFEPNSVNYRVLQCSADANPRMTAYLHLYNYGLSDAPQNGLCMKVASHNQGHSFIQSTNTTNGCESPISLDTLDNFWRSILKRRRIDLLKIDIEGFEPKAFMGAQEMLAKAPPVVILTEITPYASRQYGRSVEQMIEQLTLSGYTGQLANECVGYKAGAIVDAAMIQRFTRFRESDLCDLIFLHAQPNTFVKN